MLTERDLLDASIEALTRAQGPEAGVQLRRMVEADRETSQRLRQLRARAAWLRLYLAAGSGMLAAFLLSGCLLSSR